MTAFWDIVPCSLVEVDRCFRGAYWLHHQGDDHAPVWCQSTSMRLNGALSQKAVIFILTATRTWNFTFLSKSDESQQIAGPTTIYLSNTACDMHYSNQFRMIYVLLAYFSSHCCLGSSTIWCVHFDWWFRVYKQEYMIWGTYCYIIWNRIHSS